MKKFGKILFVLVVCFVMSGAVAASATVIVGAAPYCHGYSVMAAAPVYMAPVMAIPYGYVTTSISALPVTTAITYAPYVAMTYPVMIPGPIVLPRIVTVPTYAVIR
ncbi:MAG: hypothetical protein LBT23_11160 [Synergistaceae bacterium]|nr:hypothetical protein [Synergistaceae bacterium]